MTMPRSRLVDATMSRHYHCISRCVRQTSLCGKGFEHRKTWIEKRLEFLTRQFAISVCSFAVLDNHLHVVCRLDPDATAHWTDEDVVRRWLAVYPPPELRGGCLSLMQTWIEQRCRNTVLVARYRERLQSLGWFMKALKEPLSRMANREDGCTGTFWEARYKSIAILDEQALLATCAYIDLNPLAAGIARTPEKSPHTSLRQRVQHVRNKHSLHTLLAAGRAASARSASIEGELEQSHWLCPMQDLRQQGGLREGLLPGWSLSGYLKLVDWTARLCRDGKARLSREVAGIMARLGSSSTQWVARITFLLGKTRWRGNFSATSRNSLQAIAQRHGLRWVDNAIGSVVSA